VSGGWGRCGEEESCGVLVGKAERKWWLGRLRSRWEGNIKMDFNEICWEDAEVFDLTHYSEKWRAVVYTAMDI
jgi:hypothetical protein